MREYSNNVRSNIKYVALSVHDRFDGKYLGLINTFNLPASITFKTTEITDKYGKEYTIRVPAVDSTNIEFDKAILVFRLDMLEMGAIFVTIKNSSHALLV